MPDDATIRNQLEENLTATQRRCTELLEERRRKISPEILQRALDLVVNERYRQNDKWNREFGIWPGDHTNVLVEEVGEVARAILEREDKKHLAEELVQVAAVAVAWVEDLLPKEQRAPRVYIASSYEDRARSIALMHRLEDYGIEVVSTWLREPENAGTFASRQFHADLDMADVDRCDALFAYTQDASKTPRGTLVEIGMALGQRKPVIWLGNETGECIFWYASAVWRASTVEGAIVFLKDALRPPKEITPDG